MANERLTSGQFENKKEELTREACTGVVGRGGGILFASLIINFLIDRLPNILLSRFQDDINYGIVAIGALEILRFAAPKISQIRNLKKQE